MRQLILEAESLKNTLAAWELKEANWQREKAIRTCEYILAHRYEHYAEVTEITVEFYFKEKVMPNLFPDMSRDNYEGSDDFIFGAPIHEDAWQTLYKNAIKTENGVRFYTDRPNKITILLREAHHDDDELVEAGAWLRMLLGDKNRMYAIGSFREMSLTERMLKTIGAPRGLSVMYNLPEKIGDDEK